MFLGTYSPRLDEKGRIALPAKYRDELSAGVVVTRGQERCLTVWTRDEFARRFETLRKASTGSRSARELQRMLAAGAHDDAPDKQGRVTLPVHLRSYAGLDRDVAVVGAMSRLEIWDAETWADYQASKEADFSDLDEEVLADLF